MLIREVHLRRPRLSRLGCAFLLSALSLPGCHGVPSTSPRYGGALEAIEVPLGLVTLPFFVLFDAIVLLCTNHGGDATWIGLSLLNPFCNALGGVDHDVERELEPLIASTASSADETLAALRSGLRAQGFDVPSEDGDFEVSRATSRGDRRATTLVRVHVGRGSFRVEVLLQGRVRDLGGPETADEQAALAERHGDTDAIEDRIHVRREEAARRELESWRDDTTERLFEHVRGRLREVRRQDKPCPGY